MKTVHEVEIELWTTAPWDARERIIRAYGEEIKEECAKIAESLYDKTYWDDPSAGIAATVRSLKLG